MQIWMLRGIRHYTCNAAAALPFIPPACRPPAYIRPQQAFLELTVGPACRKGVRDVSAMFVLSPSVVLTHILFVLALSHFCESNAPSLDQSFGALDTAVRAEQVSACVRVRM